METEHAISSRVVRSSSIKISRSAYMTLRWVHQHAANYACILIVFLHNAIHATNPILLHHEHQMENNSVPLKTEDVKSCVTANSSSYTCSVAIKPSLVVVIGLLVMLLLIMTVSLFMPSTFRRKMFHILCCTKSTTNNIDAGLFRTRNAMYNRSILHDSYFRSNVGSFNHFRDKRPYKRASSPTMMASRLRKASTTGHYLPHAQQKDEMKLENAVETLIEKQRELDVILEKKEAVAFLETTEPKDHEQLLLFTEQDTSCLELAAVPITSYKSDSAIVPNCFQELFEASHSRCLYRKYHEKIGASNGLKIEDHSKQKVVVTKQYSSSSPSIKEDVADVA